MEPWDIWNGPLGKPKLILAPMVDHSELPWRMLSKEYGCDVAYTPMFHAAHFGSQKKYRQRYFSTCDQDRPLIVQFCANNADSLLTAAKHVEKDCDGIDINLGCPQEIAKRGHYGAFLQDDWKLISEMATKLRNNLDKRMSVSCKIRRFDDQNRTTDYARMIERAGCTFIGVHGRTREQRGCKTGVADWTYIKAVKECVQIPVVANGNVQSMYDADECLRATGADAVMTAEGNLYNPALFQNVHPPAWTIARKYIDYVRQYPVPAGMAKSHIFKLFHRCVAMDDNHDLRCKLGQATSLDQLLEVVEAFESKYGLDCDQSVPIGYQPVPPYLCQPHFRYGDALAGAATRCDNSAGAVLAEPGQAAQSTSAKEASTDLAQAATKRIKLSG